MKRLLGRLGIGWLLLSLLFLQECYLPRSMPERTYVAIIGDLYPELEGQNVQYLHHASAREYEQAFRRHLGEELEEHNITIVAQDHEQVDFLVKPQELVLTEETTTEKVNDKQSKQLGDIFKLSHCKGRIQVGLYQEERKLRNWHVSVPKDEKLTNNRSVGQMIAGDNKNNNVYRLKELDADVFRGIVERLAEKATARITTKMYRKVK